MRQTLIYITRTCLLTATILTAPTALSQTKIDKYEADKIIFNMITNTDVSLSDAPVLFPEICIDSLEATNEKNIYKVRGKTYKFPPISQSFYVIKERKRYVPLSGEKWPVETLQNMLTGHIPSTLQLSLSHHQYGGKIRNGNIPLAALFQIFSSQMDFYACINDVTKESIHAFLIMHHQGMDYIHMLRLDIKPDAFSSKTPTAKADLYTNIPQDNIKKLFDE